MELNDLRCSTGLIFGFVLINTLCYGENSSNLGTCRWRLVEFERRTALAG